MLKSLSQLTALGIIVLGFAALPDRAEALLFSIDEAVETLVEVDPATGLGTEVDPSTTVGFDSTSLTYQASSDTIYGLGFLGAVITVDRSTGAGTQIATLDATGASVTSAFHFDPVTSAFYAVDGYLDDRLISVDVLTGATSVIGAIGHERVDAIARHGGNGVLYGVANLGNQLLSIDPVTGVGTAVASLPFSTITGLAYLPSTDQLLALDSGQLVEIDVATGDLIPIGPPSVMNPFDLQTLVVIPEPGTAVLLGLGLLGLSTGRERGVRPRSDRPAAS